MIPPQTRIRRAVLSGLYHTRAYRLLEPRARGVGAIFTLHHVRPSSPQGGFSPNRILEITPSFLIKTIKLCERIGYEFVSLDEASRRLVEGDDRAPFVSFTLDDGYADNYTHAFPVFREHGVPFTIYLCPGLLEEWTRHWWRDLEDLVATNDEIDLRDALLVPPENAPRAADGAAGDVGGSLPAGTGGPPRDALAGHGGRDAGERALHGRCAHNRRTR